MDAQELQRKKELLETLKSTKHGYDLQAATMGVHAPPYVNTERTRLAQEIETLEKEISAAEAPVISTPVIPKEQSPIPSSSNRTRRAPMFEVRHEPLPEIRSRRTFSDLDETSSEERRPILPPRHRPTYTEQATPIEYTGRRPWLIILVAAVSFVVFWFVASNPVTISPWSTAATTPTSQIAAYIIADTNPPPSYSVGQSWQKNGLKLTLETTSFDGDTILINWRLTNNSSNDLILPDTEYKTIKAPSIVEVKPEITVSCKDFSCGKNVTVEPSKTLHFTHALKYKGIKVSLIMGSLYIQSGLTDQNIGWMVTHEPVEP